jgi:hypothetical protein
MIPASSRVVPHFCSSANHHRWEEEEGILQEVVAGDGKRGGGR